MIRFWTRSLAAQFIGFMLLALASSQALSFLISWDERDKALKAVSKSEFFSRTATITRLMESIPLNLRHDVLAASETSYARFWLSEQAPDDADAWRGRAVEELARPLPNLPNFPPEWRVQPAAIDRPEERRRIVAKNAGEAWVTPASGLWSLPQPAKFAYIGQSDGFGLAVQLQDGLWLNSAYYKVVPNNWWTSQSLFTLSITALVLSVIGVLTANRIARPLRRLAVSAEALGRGESLPPLPEEGPDDIRRTAEAFNRMQQSLHRFVEDRTRMLAAIGHDLRTPLTSLRLRAEFVGDPELQQKMLVTIDEIQVMTEATIAFAKGEATVEETKTVNLNALVESLCADLEEMGQRVEYVESRKITYRCRPDGLRRAVRNLIENAIRYGGQAKVFVRQSPSATEIVVEDPGPGIPDAMREKVFSPFFRLEKSRNRETGGVGLGLSIARAIVRHHGGDIVLASNNPGLRASISLPVIERPELSPAARRPREKIAAQWTL